MSESSAGSVTADDAAAWTIHGFSAGADCVVLGSAALSLSKGLPAAIRTVCAPADVRVADDLAILADLAASGDHPLVLAAGDLDLDLPGTLDLLDSPADRTAVLLADPRNIEAPRQHASGLERAVLARVAGDRVVESVGTARHTVGNPNRVVVGLLRIRPADRRRAAEIWRQAAEHLPAELARDADLFDLALLALVRGGLPVTEQGLGYYRWSRNGVGQAGIGVTGRQQRLRSASRLGDGAYSAAVVRRLSRIGTGFALRTRLTPNLITAISLAVGLIAGLLIFTGNPVAWIAAAVLLQLALIIDCVDGEVARFTRRYSDFGGWLDGIGDRIKEYLVFAAVAAVAVRDHHPDGWLLAVIALVVVVARHLEDFSYADRNAPDRAARPALLPIGQTADGSPQGSPTTLPAAPSRGTRVAFWARKIAHVPIAERYLVLSVMLLTLQPVFVLVAAIAVSGFALLWTVGGRLLRALRRPGSYPTPSLDHQLDVGLPALLAGRIRFPYLPGMVILIIVWSGLIASICLDSPTIAWAWAVASVIVTGCTVRPAQDTALRPAEGTVHAALTHWLGWLALPLLWVAEAAVIGSLLARGIGGGLIFVTVAAIGYRRYELIYSIRLRGPAGPRALVGADGRILTVGVLFTVSALAGNREVIIWGLLVLAIETLAEAVLGTAIRWRRPHGRLEHQQTETGSGT